MTDLCPPDEIDFEECGCSISSSSCIHVRGKGSVGNPLIFEPYIASEDDNIISCGDDGIFAEMADRFVWPTMRKVRSFGVPLEAEFGPIPFTEVEYDPYGMSMTPEIARIPFDAKWRVETYAEFDNNDGSFNTLRLEFSGSSGFVIVSASRENRDTAVVHETFVYHADEFAMKAGDRLRITVGEDASGPVTITRASFVVTLVSL